jgi:hypothetical protein
MKFTIGIKPTIITGWGTTKAAKQKVRESASQCFCYSTIGNGYMNTKYVYGYNIEIYKRGKHRHNKHYVIYKYTFPKEIFNLLNIEISQGSRTFKIIRKK